MRRYAVPDWWSVDLPHGWQVTEHPECTTFEPEKGESAFRVSAHRKDTDVTDEDLRAFAGDISLTPIKLPHFTGFESTSTEHQLFSRSFWLRSGQFMLFVTYTCPLGARGREDSVVEEMLRSLSCVDVTHEA